MIVKEYMLSKEELKHDFPIGSKHIIDGKEVVVAEIHDPMAANCMASYPMVFFEEVASTQNYETSHTCNCQHNSNSRDNEPCCRCDSRQTNADRIRNMSDEELAESNLCPHMVNWKKGNYDTCVHPNDKDACKKCMLDWLQSEAE